MYYAPWCQHSQSLTPIWEDLATELSTVKDLIIGKFDATANEAKELSLRGYPTLRLHSKDSKFGIDYEGDRDVVSFKKWLFENSPAY